MRPVFILLSTTDYYIECQRSFAYGLEILRRENLFGRFTVSSDPSFQIDTCCNAAVRLAEGFFPRV